MKKYIKWYTAIAVTGFMIILAGCHKLYDYIESHPNAEIKFCPIKKFSYNTEFVTDTIEFSYNLQGNPVKGTRRLPRTGFPNFLFWYDGHGRLTDYIGVYGDGRTTEFWHRYSYDNQGRVTTDSVFIFASIVNGNPSTPYDTYTSKLTFDSKERVIKEIIYYPNASPNVINYVYDANGNRVGPTYDQKVNFHRTNKVWMLIDREYSLNNPFKADRYNAYSLPIKIDLSAKGGEQNFLYSYYSEATIDYLCK